MKFIFTKVISYSFLLLALPGEVFAAPHGAPHISHLFWYVVNFCLYIAFLFWVLRKPLGKFWQSRREEIELAVTKGEQEMQAAKAALMEATERMSSLTPEYLKGVVQQIEKEAHEEAKKVVEVAESAAMQVQAHATQSIESEWIKSEQIVRQEIARQVIEKASARVKESYSEEMDRKRREVAVSGSRSLIQ